LDCQKHQNHKIASIRACVKHSFAAKEEVGGKLICVIGQTHATFTIQMKVAIYNLHRLCFFKRQTTKLAGVRVYEK